MAQYIIAHDLGTSGNKATLFDVENGPVKSITVSYDVCFRNKNYAEQNPEDWWNAVCSSTRQILEQISPKDVIAVSFSAQMQCCLPVDKNGTPLYPAIIWADGRASDEAGKLIHELGMDRIYQVTGHRPSPNYTLEKLMWLKEHEPAVYQKTYKSLQAKDYMIYRLTDRFVTDYSDASGTQMLELDTLRWSDEILRAADIPADIMPELHRSVDVIGGVTDDAAKQTGLLSGTPVVCGGGDGPCSAIGAGCTEDNAFFTSFGTSAWIGGTTKEKMLDDEKICFCFAHVIPGRFMPCGTMQAAGSSYSYIRSVLAPELSYGELNKEIEKSPAGAKGLLFLPYLLGERSPRWNEKTSGAFLGIRTEHKREDYLRAVLEGIGYNLELILKSFRENKSIDSLLLTGGGAQGDVLCQILADIMGAKLQSLSGAENATAIAAAMIGGVGVGAYESFDACKKFISYDREYLPNPEHKETYSRMKRIFDDSYFALMHVFEQL